MVGLVRDAGRLAPRSWSAWSEKRNQLNDLACTSGFGVGAFLEIASSSTLVDFVDVDTKLLPDIAHEGDILSVNFFQQKTEATVVRAVVRNVSSDGIVTLEVFGHPCIVPDTSQPLRTTTNYIQFDVSANQEIFMKFQRFMTLEQWQRLHQ